ncbi:hypothetical protein BTR23_23505 [Alkalihalophilus pseudofirmus]|nr:hypothetical protein BTR23_23505 [Alkalihalophilus pseudofirmus]
MEHHQLSNSRETFLLEQDWHIGHSTLSLLSTVATPIKEIKKDENLHIEEIVYEVQQLLMHFTENHSFVLGIDIEPERFTSRDYPVQFIEYLRSTSQEGLYEKFENFSRGMKDQDIENYGKDVTQVYILLLHSIDKLVEFRHQLLLKKVGLLNFKKKKHLANIVEYTDKLIEVRTLIKPRLISLIRLRYKEIVHLFEYKMLFVYLQQVFSPKEDFPVIEDEALEDSLQALQTVVINHLIKVSEDDLWLLGNHVFERYSQLVEHELDFIYTGQRGKLEDAKLFREKLIQAFVKHEDLSYLILLVPLLRNEDFTHRIHEEILPFRQLYQLLNASLLAVIQKYENGDLAALSSLGIVDSEETFIQFIHVLGFYYDSSYNDLSSGIPVNIETCSTLDVERTTIPAQDMFVSKVHNRGIFHNDTCIRRNLVTVYQFQLEEEKR